MATATVGHKATAVSIDSDRIVSLFVEAIPGMDKAEQDLTRMLYQMLANGKPVSFDELANVIDRPEHDMRAVLVDSPGVFFNDDNDIIGFWGIAVTPMGHRMEIGGITTYTWCAWDSLFIPELVGATAHITSKCEQSGEEITLTVSPDGATAENHDDVVVSFVAPGVEELRTNATASFCRFVYFFKNRQSGETWLRDHEDAFLLTLDEAFAVGKKLNAARFSLVLN